MLVILRSCLRRVLLTSILRNLESARCGIRSFTWSLKLLVCTTILPRLSRSRCTNSLSLSKIPQKNSAKAFANIVFLPCYQLLFIFFCSYYSFLRASYPTIHFPPGMKESSFVTIYVLAKVAIDMVNILSAVGILSTQSLENAVRNNICIRYIP